MKGVDIGNSVNDSDRITKDSGPSKLIFSYLYLSIKQFFLFTIYTLDMNYVLIKNSYRSDFHDVNKSYKPVIESFCPESI